MVRATVGFPEPVFDELNRLAESKKVSFGWVVREAAEKYLIEQWPLLGSPTVAGGK